MAHDPVQNPVGATPGYPDIRTYIDDLGYLNVWEGDGWKRESMSWKESAYLAINLSGPMEFTYRGPRAQEFLSSLVINDVMSWRIGSSKHLVMTDPEGLVVSHGLAVRDDEETFRILASLPWPAYRALQQPEPEGVEVTWRDVFILQIAGPRSAEIIEKALGEDVRDLRFLAARPARVGGAGVEVELSRIGMTGSLAYEMRGAYSDGPAVYDAVYRAGRDAGIVRLGYRTYAVNHTEGGFPQMSFHFLSALLNDAEFMSSPFARSLKHPFTGSVDPADRRARLRTPGELNWAWMAKFDHDFVGRAAVEAEAERPLRRTVILRWNPDDVLDVFASHFRPGEEYSHIEFPASPPSPAGGHADLVTKGDRVIGVSSAAVYSYFSRAMISQAVIDIDETALGNEVVLHWGEYGGRIKHIRATVEKFPYLELPRNRDIDLVAEKGTT